MNYSVLLHSHTDTHMLTHNPFIKTKAVAAEIKVPHEEQQERTTVTLGSLMRQEGRRDMEEMDGKTDVLPAGEC